MAARIVRQPNGLLARFSTVVDDFTDMDLTESEAVVLCNQSMGYVQAIEKVRRGLNDEPFGGIKSRQGDGLDRWRDALDTIRVLHGPKVAAEREAMISPSVPAAPDQR